MQRVNCDVCLSVKTFKSDALVGLTITGLLRRAARPYKT